MDGTGSYPLADPPTEWSPTRNVLWATPMPGWSNASPILVGDRLLVLSEPDTLVCLSAVDGRILWQQSNPIRDAVPASTTSLPHPDVRAEERRAQPALKAKEHELSRVRRLLGRSPDDPELRLEAETLKREAEGLRRQLASLAPALPPQIHPDTGYSTPTPASDGTWVYAFFATGVVASYDLTGRRRWIRYVDQPQLPNGISASPVLAGGKLLLLIDDLVALDPATGDVEWRGNVPARQGTPIAFAIQGQDVVVTPSGHCVRVADGALLASGLGDLDYASPLVRDGVLYMIQGTARAFTIPEQMADELTFQPLWTRRLNEQRYYGSPLLHEDLIYALTDSQRLTVLDAKTGELVYARELGLGPMGNDATVYASLAHGRRHIFASGLGGTTAVFEPGRRYEQVASNQLEKFRSSPVLDGHRMYVRGYSKLYCISTPPERDPRPGGCSAPPR